MFHSWSGGEFSERQICETCGRRSVLNYPTSIALPWSLITQCLVYAAYWRHFAHIHQVLDSDGYAVVSNTFTTTDLLLCQATQTLWLSWKQGVVSLGTGGAVGENRVGDEMILTPEQVSDVMTRLHHYFDLHVLGNWVISDLLVLHLLLTFCEILSWLWSGVPHNTWLHCRRLLWRHYASRTLKLAAPSWCGTFHSQLVGSRQHNLIKFGFARSILRRKVAATFIADTHFWCNTGRSHDQSEHRRQPEIGFQSQQRHDSFWWQPSRSGLENYSCVIVLVWALISVSYTCTYARYTSAHSLLTFA